MKTTILCDGNNSKLKDVGINHLATHSGGKGESLFISLHNIKTIEQTKTKDWDNEAGIYHSFDIVAEDKEGKTIEITFFSDKPLKIRKANGE